MASGKPQRCGDGAQSPLTLTADAENVPVAADAVAACADLLLEGFADREACGVVARMDAIAGTTLVSGAEFAAALTIVTFCFVSDIRCLGTETAATTATVGRLSPGRPSFTEMPLIDRSDRAVVTYQTSNRVL